MTVLWSALSYVVAFVVVVLIGALAELPFFMLVPLLRRATWLSPLGRVVKETAAIVAAVYFLTILAHNTPLRVSVLMLLIPFFMHFRNDLQRIGNVKAGRSGVFAQLQAAGNAASYDQQNDLHSEYGSLIGHMVGFTLVFSFFLQGARFL